MDLNNHNFDRLVQIVGRRGGNPNRVEILGQLAKNDFDVKAFADHYSIPLRDFGMVRRAILSIKREHHSAQHRKDTVNVTALNVYDAAVYKAVQNGVTLDELMIWLDFRLKEDLYASILNSDLLDIVKNLDR